MTTSYFDERAKDWDANPARVERARSVAEAMRRQVSLTTKMSALEYGCGTGLLSFALQADFGKITLADSSQGMLDVLAEKIKSAGLNNMHPMLLDLSTDPLPAESFDITYSLMTLHHVPDAKGLLKKFHALLKPSGILCVADLDKEDGSFHTDDKSEVHNGFERAEIQKWVENSGFTGVEFSTPYVNKKKIEEVEKSFPVFLLTARKA